MLSYLSSLGAWWNGVCRHIQSARLDLVGRLALIIVNIFLKLKTTFSKFQKWRQRVPSQRPPLLLTVWGMALQLGCQMAIIITICGLWHKSNRDNGIATVGDGRNPYFDSTGFHAVPILDTSIVWTTVPAWIISAYSTLWSAMVDSLKKVQPLLELEKAKQVQQPNAKSRKISWSRLRQVLSISNVPPSHQAHPPSHMPPTYSTAKRTLLLDYGEWPILNGLKAIKVGHILVGICLLTRAALWTASGLAAAIFAVATVPSNAQVALYSDKAFDEYLGWESGKGSGNSSFTPALDIVSATVLRDGETYPWTTDTHSFLPHVPASGASAGNYTFDTEAYWATVECDVATEEDLVRVDGIRIDKYPGDKQNSADLQIGFRYEDCAIDKWFTIANNTLRYARSWSTACSLASGQARIGMFAGVYNASEKFLLSNLTVVTCKPLVYKSNGTLTVSVANDTAFAKVLNFVEENREQFWPFFMRGWIANIPWYSVFDPTVYADVDTFSRLVIGHASGNPTLDTIPGKLQIVESFVVVFQAAFSNFVTLQGYINASRRETTGTVSRQQLRLFVVRSASLAVICIIATTVLTTLILAIHLYRDRKILERYLDLMLGNAILFRDAASSGLETYLDTLIDRADRERQNGGDVNLVKYAEKQQDLNDWPV